MMEIEKIMENLIRNSIGKKKFRKSGQKEKLWELFFLV